VQATPRRSTATTLALTALVVAVLGVVPLLTTHAQAVQTKTFVLAAAGNRTRLSHPSTGADVTDKVVVGNLTQAPLTLDLGVVGVTAKANGFFDLGAAGAGLAAHVRLAATRVTLRGRESRQIGVTIDTSSVHGTPAYAAVTAIPEVGASAGIGVQTRLALLVEVTAPGAGGAGGARHGGSSKGAAIGAAAALAAVTALGLLFLLARRRRADP
jgi:hypothetical protein